MNKNAIYILSMLALLAGCATDPLTEQRNATKLMEYKMQVYGPACEKLGFAKDTDAWRDCVQREYEQSIIRMQNFNNSAPYWSPYYGRPYYRR